MQDLREKTHTVHYQFYRSNRMTKMGFTDVTADNKPVRWIGTNWKMLFKLNHIIVYKKYTSKNVMNI